MRLSCLLLLILASAAAAQMPIRKGARVRRVPVSPSESVRVGKVITPGADSALVRFEPNPSADLEEATEMVSYSRLETVVSTSRRTGKGAAIGALVGALGGAAWGRFGDWDPVCEGSPTAGFVCHPDRSAIAPLAVVGGFAGVFVGSFVGHFVKNEIWKPITAGR